MRKCKECLIALIVCLVSHTVLSQKLPFKFHKHNLDQEIFYDQIEDILIDRDGFFWIATSTGLYMYDGYEFITYLHNSSSKTSLSENYVTTLFEDLHGLIWIGTYNNGLNVYDKKTNTFFNYRHVQGDINSLSSNKIPRGSTTIQQDNSGLIWVGTESGINKINHSNGSIERIDENLRGEYVINLKDSCIWTFRDQLQRYDQSNSKLIDVELPQSNLVIHSVVRGDSTDLWLATNFGLKLFSLKYNRIIDKVPGSDQLPSEIIDVLKMDISAIYYDRGGSLWLGVDNQIVYLNAGTGSYHLLQHDRSIEYGLLDEEIRGIYGNDSDKVIITYESKGITIINTDVKKFRNVPFSAYSVGTLNSNIRSIFKDEGENLWIGSYNQGLSKISLDGSLSNYQHEKDQKHTLTSNYITAIFIDSKNRLWVGTLEDGLCIADQIPTGQDEIIFDRYDFEEKLEIHEFFEAPNGCIWISTNTGFFLFENGELVQYGDSDNQVQEIRNINIQAVAFEEPNILWFATWNKGIGRLKINYPEGKQDILRLHDRLFDIQGNSLDNRFINIARSPDGTIWLASSVDGLVRLNAENDSFEFEKYDENKGAPSNTLYSIVEDTHSNLWLSSRNGIGKFDPNKEIFINYHESDGLSTNSFIWDSYFQAADGEIFFGGINGITSFYPDSIEEETIPMETFLSKLILNHNEVKNGDLVNDRLILSNTIRFTDQITLTHNEPSFSLEFGALNILNSNEILFSYKLSGFDKDWIVSTANNRQATYTNLKPGSYVFNVRATKNTGTWAGKPAELQIIILPPWWRTWWAIAFYVFVFLILLYVFQREAVKRSQLKQKLQLEKFMREKDNELNKDKFRFFTNLSHELRTPLTLILGPLDRLSRNDELNSRVKQSLTLIQKQAERLQKLTNQLMNFRKYEIDNLKLRAAEGNVTAFMEEISVAFRNHANLKQINFDFIHEPEEIRMYYDRDKLEIIIVNLLSNAFKFTPQNGRIELSLSSCKVESARQQLVSPDGTSRSYFGEFSQHSKKLVEIVVKDSGVGIDQKQIEHIFDRYFQASNIQSISTGGTGIGLEIAKNYVELHYGCIMVESQEGFGTLFKIWLPLGKSHLSEMDILKDFKPSEHPDHYKTDIPAKDEVSTPQFSDEDEFEPDKSSVLIIDDNPDILYFLKENFEKQYHVLQALNGKLGLELALQHVPDIIISDIMMPEIDGLEFCSRVKSDIRTSHIPVILLTARVSNIFQAEGLETGADDYITKPFDEQILNIRVNNLIQSRKQLRERYSREGDLQPQDITITSPDQEFLEKVINFIHENISDSNLKVEHIAREIGMSHSVLYKKIVALTDLTIVEFIRSTRVRHSAKILVASDKSIAQIAHEVGFTDPKYFSKVFTKYFHRSPSDYRRSK